MKPIVFWGATGQAKVLKECVSDDFELVALFDNDVNVASNFPGIPIFHGSSGFEGWRAQNPSSDISFLVAIGGDKGRDRLAIHDVLVAHGLTPVNAIHRSSFVAPDAKLGPGCQVLANATVCVGAVLGRVAIVNTAASVDHECRIGDGVHIAPGAMLAGQVSVGDFTMIGTGAVILPRVTIGRNVRVGAGSVVLEDVPSDRTVYGNPARIIEERSRTHTG
jgi:sugar O-acyltransferase (sialic acid O-acetyltransferase NeuD family)